MTLDARPSDAQLLARSNAIAERRRPGPPRPGTAHAGESWAITDSGLCAPINARRTGDALFLEIFTPPRTKKNHRAQAWSRKQEQFVPVPAKAYEKFKREIAGSVVMLRTHLGLPLPDRAYNIAARFFVDGYGKNADTDGLLAGIFDALEYAGVVTDDWFFRTVNGTEVLPADPDPRVEITLTPIVAP